MRERKAVMQRIAIMLLDAVCIALAGGLAYFFRFDFHMDQIPAEYAYLWFRGLVIRIAVTWLLFVPCKMYRFIWRSVGAGDVLKMFLVCTLAFGLYEGINYVVFGTVARSIYCISYILVLAFQVGLRCFARFFFIFFGYRRRRNREGTSRILVYGAGAAGVVLIRELQTSENSEGTPCCILDDNSGVWGRNLENVPVVGGIKKLREAVNKYRIDQIILAIPSAPAKTRSEILRKCQETGCRVRTLPSVMDMAYSPEKAHVIRDVKMEDLLGREPVKLDTQLVQTFLSGKTVLVTGGGGSIGGELCRQIARYEPKKLIILDIYENNAYDLQQELRQLFGDRLRLQVEIASVRDKQRIYDLFREERPDVVFHAAAHKHVPLMETCPQEAVKNNIFGTYHVVRAAEKSGVKKFVMISTDKAVNPTNFMGATKRFCEMILQSRFQSQTEFCAVRFGNVLGSNGSVVPLFRRQIAAGGPVTITDKRIIRYFMTIPEAAALVLEAGAMAKQSQIFVLDMGEPVKILHLAESVIRMSGYVPYEDIDIREIGLRPGEKLYEELLMNSNTLSKTANEKIFVEQQSVIPPEEILSDLEMLDHAVESGMDAEKLILLLREIVPTYVSPESVNEKIGKRSAAAAKH